MCAVCGHPNEPPYHYSGCRYSHLYQPGSSGSGSSGSSPKILKKPDNKDFSKASNKLGIASYKKGDYQEAIEHFKDAIRLDPDNEKAKKHLKMAKAMKANQDGIRAWDEGDAVLAAAHYRASLSYYHFAVVEANLRDAEAVIEQEKRDQEAERTRLQQEEEMKQQRLDNSKKKIEKILEGLKEEFTPSSMETKPTESSSSLEFIGSGESLFSKGSQSSAPVDFSALEKEKTLAVDSQVSTQKSDLKDAPGPKLKVWTNEVHELTAKALNSEMRGNYDEAIKYYREALKSSPNDRAIQICLGHTLHLKDQGKKISNPKAEILLDALQEGKGDWEKSIIYLQKEIKNQNDNDKKQAARDALNYTKGLYAYEQFVKSQDNAKLTEEFQEIEVESYIEPFTKRAIVNGLENLKEAKIKEAAKNFKTASLLDPEDESIKTILQYVRGLDHGSRYNDKENELDDSALIEMAEESVD